MGKSYILVDKDKFQGLFETLISPPKPKAGILPSLDRDEQKKFEILDTKGRILFVLLKRKKVLGYKSLGMLVGVSAKTVERYLNGPLMDIVKIEDVIRDPRNNRFIGSKISLEDRKYAEAILEDELNKSRNFYSIFE